jgi:hypothetical protein
MFGNIFHARPQLPILQRAAAALLLGSVALTAVPTPTSAHADHRYTVDFTSLTVEQRTEGSCSWYESCSSYDELYVITIAANTETGAIRAEKTPVFKNMNNGSTVRQTVNVWGTPEENVQTGTKLANTMLIMAQVMEEDDDPAGDVFADVATRVKNELKGYTDQHLSRDTIKGLLLSDMNDAVQAAKRDNDPQGSAQYVEFTSTQIANHGGFQTKTFEGSVGKYTVEFKLTALPPMPDLRVPALASNARQRNSDPAKSNLSFTVRNEGDAAVTPSFVVKIYRDGVEIWNSTVTNDIAAGGSLPLTAVLPIAYCSNESVKITVDTGNAVRESNELDNSTVYGWVCP